MCSIRPFSWYMHKSIQFVATDGPPPRPMPLSAKGRRKADPARRIYPGPDACLSRVLSSRPPAQLTGSDRLISQARVFYIRNQSWRACGGLCLCIYVKNVCQVLKNTQGREESADHLVSHVCDGSALRAAAVLPCVLWS